MLLQLLTVACVQGEDGDELVPVQQQLGNTQQQLAGVQQQLAQVQQQLTAAEAEVQRQGLQLRRSTDDRNRLQVTPIQSLWYSAVPASDLVLLEAYV